MYSRFGGEETTNPYRGYVTYLTTKSRRTLVHPNAVLSMMKQLPKGASWTGVRRTRGVRDDGGEFGVDDNFMDPNMDIHSVKGNGKERRLVNISFQTRQKGIVTMAHTCLMHRSTLLCPPLKWLTTQLSFTIKLAIQESQTERVPTIPSGP